MLRPRRTLPALWYFGNVLMLLEMIGELIPKGILTY
jgi:hypothetical protein